MAAPWTSQELKQWLLDRRARERERQYDHGAKRTDSYSDSAWTEVLSPYYAREGAASPPASPLSRTSSRASICSVEFGSSNSSIGSPSLLPVGSYLRSGRGVNLGQEKGLLYPTEERGRYFRAKRHADICASDACSTTSAGSDLSSGGRSPSAARDRDPMPAPRVPAIPQRSHPSDAADVDAPTIEEALCFGGTLPAGFEDVGPGGLVRIQSRSPRQQDRDARRQRHLKERLTSTGAHVLRVLLQSHSQSALQHAFSSWWRAATRMGPSQQRSDNNNVDGDRDGDGSPLSRALSDRKAARLSDRPFIYSSGGYSGGADVNQALEYLRHHRGSASLQHLEYENRMLQRQARQAAHSERRRVAETHLYTTLRRLTTWRLAAAWRAWCIFPAPHKPPANAPPANSREPEADVPAGAPCVAERTSEEIFAAANADSDCPIDFAEFCQFVESDNFREHISTEIFPMEMLQSIFREIDHMVHGEGTGVGRIPLSEYIQWAIRESLIARKAKVLDTFRQWDADASGFIDVKEFSQALQALGFRVGSKVAKRVFAGFDSVSQGGTIEYDELNKTLRRGPSSQRYKERLAAESRSPSRAPSRGGSLHGGKSFQRRASAPNLLSPA